MKKLTLIPTLSLVVSLLISTTTFAYPSMLSSQNQSFAKNASSTVISDTTITDDTTPFIKAQYGIRIQIPQALSAIFDASRTKNEISFYGTAIDNGKISANPSISFGDKDKTIVIPVLKDFSAGESVTIRNLSIKGFHDTTGDAQYLLFIYDDSGTAMINEGYISIYNSTNSDNNPPLKPTDVKITQVDNTSVKLTWTNPTDLDIAMIDILRGLNANVNGIAYKQIGKDKEEFVDTGLKVGDTVKYLIRAEDGPNTGDLSNEVSLTLVDMTTTPESVETPETPETPATPEATVIPESTVPTPSEETTAQPETTSSEICQSFTDITPEDAFCPTLKSINQNNIITGYTDGILKTFKGDNEINRAELLKLVLLFANTEIQHPAQNEPIFSDVNPDEWYANYVHTAKKLGIIDGYPNGTFMPAQAVNKAEAVKIMLKTLKAETGIVSSAPYEDTEISQNNAWYLPYAKYMKDNIDQTSDIFTPDHFMTRREIVEMLNSLEK